MCVCVCVCVCVYMCACVHVCMCGVCEWLWLTSYTFLAFFRLAVVSLSSSMWKQVPNLSSLSLDRPLNLPLCNGFSQEVSHGYVHSTYHPVCVCVCVCVCTSGKGAASSFLRSCWTHQRSDHLEVRCLVCCGFLLPLNGVLCRCRVSCIAICTAREGGREGVREGVRE